MHSPLAILVLAVTAATASAQVVLKQGDILVAEPGTASISVVDSATGARTVISEGGLLALPNRAVGVALALDGTVIVVHRDRGLIRVDPATGAQSLLSEGEFFSDPWAITIDQNTGAIYVADSGYDNDRPAINEAGKIIRVDPVTGAQEVIASGTPCNVFPSGAACQNTTSAGSYLTHPYGIAIDYTVVPGSIVVADMSSFNGSGAIIRIQPVPNGTQTLLWGPASAVPPPQVAQQSPLACPMGVAVEPNGNILTTVFTFPIPPAPTSPPPAGTFYGCAPPGIYRIDLVNNVQQVVSANAPSWQPSHAYSVGDVIHEETTGHVHKVVTAGLSQGSTPAWNGTIGGNTNDGAVVWQNIGLGANWLVPFGVEAEPAPSNPSQPNVIVGDEGYSMVFRLDATGAFTPSGAPLVAGTANVTSVDVITFTPPGGSPTPPVRSNGQPVGTLPSGTTQATLSLTTNENATCRFSLVAGVAYESMTNTFATTGGTAHSTTVTGLTDGGSYIFYVRCMDAEGNANTTDFDITFSVASASGSTSNFSGTENPLSEGGTWDSPGSWADLQKNDGAFATGLNAQARLVTPAMPGDHYAVITYDQDPGAESWVGVTTRSQSATDGSGYLAIAFAGEVRLYRTDDAGTLNFTLLAAASAPVGTPPRQLRLESEGNTHRVFFNGTQVISQTDAAYSGGQPGIAASVFGGPQVRILSFEGGALGTPPSDTTPPVRSNGQPVGTLPSGTTQAAVSLTTNENATCRFSLAAGVVYESMTNTFATTGGTAHSTPVNGLTDGGSYTFYVRCVDGLDNANTNDFVITFSVASASGTASSFAGSENPLSEGGIWDSPGAWADLQKNDGAFATGLNAQGRLVTPAMPGDQYSAMTFDQDPGSQSWVGVTTRTQSATNGSGYLAIAFAGEVRLYRTDDSGSLNFTLLAGVSAAIGTAPRQLRLESEGSTHRVFFNGTQVISHTDATYSGGQPGIAASVFGGPQVKILSFEGGALGGSSGALLAIDNVTVTEGNAGTTNAVFTVTLSGAFSSDVTVDFATAGGTATSGVDFVTTSGTLTFTPGGVTQQTVTVPVNSDLLNEADEQFAVNLSNAVNATIGTAQGTGTILNDDPVPSLSVGDVSISEGDTGTKTATFNITLNAPSGQTVTVAYATVNGNATAGSDYVAASGTATFPAGTTSVPVDITINGDTVVEPDETYFVGLSSPANATIEDPEGVGTIVNDDTVPTLSIGDVSVTEGLDGSVNATLTVSLSSASGQAVSVAYATADDTATAGADYTAAAGTVHFAAGETSKTVTVSVLGDALDEVNETFFVNLSAPSNATILDGQGVVTILDDDPSPELTITDLEVLEGDSGTVDAVLTVRLSGASGQVVQVNYATTNGAATAGADYAAASGTLTFAPGDTFKLLTLAVAGDVLDESDETFTVNLTGPSNATLFDGVGVVTITDDDPTPTLSVADVSVTEGNSGNVIATFTVTLSAASGRTVTVQYATANGTASSSSDYIATSGTATFPPGTTAVDIGVPVRGDTVPENDETFAFNLTAPVNATIQDAQAIGTILNDDALPALSVSDRTVTERDSGTVNAKFTITLSPSSGSTVTVAYATADGTALAGPDYVAQTGTLTFTPGATSRTITILVNSDLLDENNETYIVNLSAPTNATIADGEGLGTINDNDPLPSISIADISVAEGNSGTTPAAFTLTLSRESGRTVSVAYVTANGSATAGSDYVATSGTAVFPAGVTSVQVPVSVNGDIAEESNENFMMNLSGATNATIARTQGVAVILDDDDDGLSAAPGLVAAYGFEEGSGTTTADASQNGHTASIAGATWTTEGRNGNALSFDGVNDLVSIADSALLDVTRVTLMAWVRPTSLGGWRTVVMKERIGGLAYALYASDSQQRPRGYVNTGLLSPSAEGTTSLPLDTWTHLAVTHNGSKIRLYINGALVRTRNASGNIVTTSQMLRIGGNTVWGEYFAGLIDEVRVYNRALNQSEIQTEKGVPVP